MKKFCILIILLLPLSLFAQYSDLYIEAHFYPHSLSPQDSLQDGPYGKKFEITEDTFLIWIDLFPGLFFSHKTVYILISKDNVQVESGDWWPELNGKMILHNELSKFALISPFELPLISAGEFIENRIDIHVYPHELTSLDQLTDGPQEKLFMIYNNSLLVWVDLLPGAFFAHPTAYILISKENVRVEHGNWWPILNGRTILYGQKNKTGIISPFKVSYRFQSLKNNKKE